MDSSNQSGQTDPLPPRPGAESERESEGRFFAIVIYALLGFGLFAVLPWIAAAIIYYIKIEDVVGTIYESHLRWQIRTFWFSILIDTLAVVFAIVTFGVGFIVAWPVIVIIHFWIAYRIIKGIIRLGERREIIF